MNTINCLTRLFAFTILLAAVFIAGVSNADAAKGKKSVMKPTQKKLWQQIDESNLRTSNLRASLSDKVPVYSLNRAMLNNILDGAPIEFSEAAQKSVVVLEVPTPDGNIVRFRIEESPMLAPEVAAQFPTWKQYSGQGIDDPTATARFDTNANGFHGYIISAKGTFLIDPYSLTDQKNYIVYYKGDLGGTPQSFSCKVSGGGKIDETDVSFRSAAPQAFSNGTQLRTYRLAVSATKEYTNFFGGNQTTAFAAVQTTVNRMIGIYRRELATTFTLVSDLRTIFTNANDGGFNNTSAQALTRNQVVMDATYGNTAYDIGHVFSVTPNPDGLASSPSLCINNGKAGGFTGAPNPQGDGYDVDYVAHEIGHQFGMSHTFNNDADGSCSTRSADSAYEPASGVTIMGYAGICTPRNLAENSIEYFNLRSFDQSLKWFQDIENGTYGGIDQTCGTPTANGNIAPTVTSPGNFTIPKLTPFTLTAAATDPNGDSLTYLWEEFDLGGATRNGGAVDSDNDGTARPIFRAYNPTTGGARTFPSLYYILNPQNNDPSADVNGVRGNQPTLTYTGTLPFAPTSGSTNGYVCKAGETCARGERLPTIDRAMTFRTTVRDNRAGGGGIADAQSTVTVAAGAGPFQITTQNSNVVLTLSDNLTAPEATWQAGTTQTVTWDVANTNAAPINAANVNILLSTDGGLTFPITILANTPNDGTQAITVPNNPTQTARIKVEAVGNVFFDINNVDFAILAPTAAPASISGRVVSRLGRGISGAFVTLTDQNGAVRTARTNGFGYYRFDGIAAGENYVVGASHKRYAFSPQTISVNENISGLELIAEN